MRDRLFLGTTYKKDSEPIYHVANCVDFGSSGFSKRELKTIIRTIKNAYIDKEGLFHTTDGLTYGVNSDDESLSINTYTIIGFSAGYYIIRDFKGSEWFALSSREMSMNREKFTNRIFTNAFIYPSIDGVMLNITPINNAFVDILTESRLSCEIGQAQLGFEFLRNLIVLRLSTVHSGEFKLHKFGDFNRRLLESNLEEVIKVLENEYLDKRLLLEKYASKQPKNGQSVLERIYLNSVT